MYSPSYLFLLPHHPRINTLNIAAFHVLLQPYQALLPPPNAIPQHQHRHKRDACHCYQDWKDHSLSVPDVYYFVVLGLVRSLERDRLLV